MINRILDLFSYRVRAQREWKQKTLDYVRDVNAFIEKGLRDGLENAGDEPQEPGRDHLVKTALAAVRKANLLGEFEALRDRWPPVHAPLIDVLENNGQNIPVLCLLADGSIIARIGASYEEGRTVRLDGNHAEEESDVGFFGRCPNRRFFGVARESGIAILDGWRGPEVSMCPWPSGTEQMPPGIDMQPWDEPPRPSRIIPFPDGTRVLMVSENGIFVMSPSGAHRLLPTHEQIVEHHEWSESEHPGEPFSLYISMEHGAISKDGKLIAVGCQDSTHLVYDENLKKIANIGNQSEYPHYAVFSADQTTLALNSCHFYNGLTIGVPTRVLPGLNIEPYSDDERTPTIENGSRIYSAVSRNDEFIVGDAAGYVRAFSLGGERRWAQFIGSSVGDIDISDDGRTLIVSTYAGFISALRLDEGQQAPHQIGFGGHFEQKRWIFWKNEPMPLIW